VSAILLDEDGKILNGDSNNFIFYNNLDHPTGSVHHTGDNRTGEGDGDDEVIIIDTSKLPAGCRRSRSS
jgi:tellurium resistance protein TerD